jgi:hypothetical protein
VAQRICAALQAAGIEVWFDQSELRGVLEERYSDRNDNNYHSKRQ